MNLTQHYALTGFQKVSEPTLSNKLERLIKSDPGL